MPSELRLALLITAGLLPKIIRLFLPLMLVICGASQAAFSQQVLKVPQRDGAPVLIDGKFSAGEWQGAATENISGSVRLHLKQSKGHVFIGVEMRTPSPSYVDLFLLTEENQLYNLHASMRVGERWLKDSVWDDSKPAWRWGNNVDWIASVAKLDETKDRSLSLTEQFFPYDGMEFQIRRARFQGTRWRVRIEVRDFTGKMPDIVFPAASTRTNVTGWAVLKLA